MPRCQRPWRRARRRRRPCSGRLGWQSSQRAPLAAPSPPPPREPFSAGGGRWPAGQVPEGAAARPVPGQPTWPEQSPSGRQSGLALAVPRSPAPNGRASRAGCCSLPVTGAERLRPIPRGSGPDSRAVRGRPAGPERGAGRRCSLPPPAPRGSSGGWGPAQKSWEPAGR